MLRPLQSKVSKIRPIHMNSKRDLPLKAEVSGDASKFDSNLDNNEPRNGLTLLMKELSVNSSKANYKGNILSFFFPRSIVNHNSFTGNVMKKVFSYLELNNLISLSVAVDNLTSSKKEGITVEK